VLPSVNGVFGVAVLDMVDDETPSVKMPVTDADDKD
jgi:hypothetical protein